MNLVIAGVGGQGILTTSRIIGEAALKNKLDVSVSEIHGMAQRGGSVVSTVRFGSFKAPLILDGDADIIIGFEPAETVRVIEKASAEKTVILMNTKPIIPFPASLGLQKYPENSRILAYLAQNAKEVVPVNASEIATSLGTYRVLNVVMVGAVARYLPFSAENFKEAIRKIIPARYAEINMKAFEHGFRAVK